MGLIYEHWRPDKNECFYVGASRDAEDTRPYYYGSRNEGYAKVMCELQQGNLEPFTVIVWKNLPRESTGTYEKLRISYQRSILGDALTNIANGGMGFNFEWTDSLRDKHRLGCLTAGAKPEVKEARSIAQKEAQNRAEVKKKRSNSLIASNSKPEVIQRRSSAAERAHERPDVSSARVQREKDPILNEKRKRSARLGGLAAGQKSKEELSARGRKAAQTRATDKLFSAAVVSFAILGAL
jgi:hypothetical protein